MISKSVCLYAHISLKPHVRTSPNLQLLTPMMIKLPPNVTCSRGSSGSIVITHIVPVLWMMSNCPTMVYGGILLPCSIVNVDGLMPQQCSNWWQPVLHDDDQMSPLCKKCWRRVCNHHHHRFNMQECSMNNKIHDKTHKMIQKYIIRLN